MHILASIHFSIFIALKTCLERVEISTKNEFLCLWSENPIIKLNHLKSVNWELFQSKGLSKASFGSSQLKVFHLENIIEAWANKVIDSSHVIGCGKQGVRLRNKFNNQFYYFFFSYLMNKFLLFHIWNLI